MVCDFSNKLSPILDICMWLTVTSWCDYSFIPPKKSSWFLLPSQCVCERTLASVSHHKYYWRTSYFLPWQHLTFQITPKSSLKVQQDCTGTIHMLIKMAYYFKVNAFLVLVCPLSSISILLKIRKIHQQWWIMQYVLFVAETKRNTWTPTGVYNCIYCIKARRQLG